MSNDDFFDFMVFWELMFPEDEDRTYECPSCGRVISGGEKVPWIDKKNQIFKCPGCEELLKLNDDTGELVEVEGRQEEDKLEKREISFSYKGVESSQKFTDKGFAFYLDLITLDLKERKKNEIIKEMVAMFTRLGILKEGKYFYEDLLETERAMGSTALGGGIAFPYAYTELGENVPEEIIVSLAIFKEGVDFGSADNQPVKIIFMTAYSKTSKNSPHIKFLARLSRFVRGPGVVKTLLEARSREEVIGFLRNNFLTIR